jgi:hypothetical protein
MAVDNCTNSYPTGLVGINLCYVNEYEIRAYLAEF